ncbi:MAG TPA: spermidine/putrescine ABC transporter substrate-binding protein [Acidimicrobiales bacterium]|nr:spermidine/putrescine ABC transporter substrate-binding protein [Acidimicrobiales bacterium]
MADQPRIRPVRLTASPRMAASPLSRRRFLSRAGLVIGGVALGPTILAACGDDDGGSNGGDAGGDGGGGGGESTLRISNWPLYIDEETVADFEAATGLSVTYTEDVNDNDEYFAKIQEPLSRGQDIGADLFVVTDWMAARLITLGWVAEIDAANVPNKSNLVASLQGVQFDPDRAYSLPWQSGMTGIIYNADALGRELTSVEELFDPELAGSVTFLTEMRDTMGLLLLANGVDPSGDFTDADFDAALARLTEARDAGQIRRFTGNDYGDDLASGNVVAAVGWSGDAVQLQADNPSLRFAVPTEGGMLWSDNMMIPTTASAGAKANAEAWMNYVYDPEAMGQITEWVAYIPPVEGTGEFLSEELANDPLVNPDDELRSRLSVFRGLDEDTEQRYNEAFQNVVRA